MNKKIMIVVTAALTTIGAYASWPVQRPIIPGAYTAARTQVALNQVAYQGRYATTVAPARAVAPAKTSNLPGTVRTVYVRAKHKTVTGPNGVKQKVYIPAHYETRVGTYN